ncbi:MAG: helix-turn-helix transcriptional regulator [Pseudomonadota bacterium]
MNGNHINKLSQNVLPEIGFHNPIGDIEFEIVDLEKLRLRSKTLQPPPHIPHKLGFHLILLIEQGRGFHWVDFEKRPFKENTVIFLNKGQVQSFDFNEQIKGKVIVYTERFLSLLREHITIPFLLHNNLLLNGVSHIELQQSIKCNVFLLTKALQIEISQPVMTREIIFSLFGSLVMTLAREHNMQHNKTPPLETKRFVEFGKIIEKYFFDQRDACFYAQKLCITYKTLNEVCKKVSGKTAKFHIDQRVILESKRRLLADEMDISTLAYDLGFNEVGNFSKFFKRYTQVTPNQFRKKVRD